MWIGNPYTLAHEDSSFHQRNVDALLLQEQADVPLAREPVVDNPVDRHPGSEEEDADLESALEGPPAPDHEYGWWSSGSGISEPCQWDAVFSQLLVCFLGDENLLPDKETLRTVRLSPMTYGPD
jgi:hypothetical protein